MPKIKTYKATAKRFKRRYLAWRAGPAATRPA
jgi:hypothetical protein